MKYNKCPKCKYTFEGQPDWCPNCGEKLKYKNNEKDKDSSSNDEQGKQELILSEPDVIFCHKCGTSNSKSNEYCTKCGEKLHKSEDDEDVIRCPKCGSTQIEFVTYQASSNFSAGNACCGYFIFGPLGLLCGTVGNDEPPRTVRKCKRCGHEF